MKQLKNSFISVSSGQETFYGGNQSWFSYKFLKKSGCGVISAADLLFYLEGKTEVSKTEYMEFAKKLWIEYFPVIPGFGMNGLTLMIGMNRYFKKHDLGYRAGWKIAAGPMVSRIDRMLSGDCPVILSVGPNFPKFWGKEGVVFYRKDSCGKYIPAVNVNAHFVTVTQKEGVYLKISSWGKEYYINLREYRGYVKKHSISPFSNILYIRQCEGGRKWELW